MTDMTERARSLSIACGPEDKGYQSHLLLCADQSKPLCCDKATGLVAWDYLKKRIRELGLEGPEATQPVFRSKVNCLRVCQNGPILLVYPGGYWYHSATPEVIERVLQEHILGGIPVQEYLFAENPLMPSGE